MADSKIHDLTEDAAPLLTDELYTVHDPTGTPADRRVQVGNFLKASRPRPVEGVPWKIYGDSKGLASPPSSTANSPYITKLQNRLNPSAVTNNSLGSRWIADTATAAIGTVNPVGASPRGIYIIDSLTNDVLGAAATKSLNGVTNAMRALILACQAESKVAATGGSFAYTGTWGTGTGAYLSSGACKATTNQNDLVTITTPSGTAFTVLLLGTDDATIVADGSVAASQSVEIKVDGSVVATLDLHNAMKQTTLNTGLSLCQYAYPITGLSNTAHTIVITKKDTTGTALFVQDLLVASATPPEIIVLRSAPWTASTYASNGGDTTRAAINTAVDTAVSGLSHVTVIDPPSVTGWSTSDMISTVDGVHFNDRGTAFYADVLQSAMAQIAWRAGVNIL